MAKYSDTEILEKIIEFANNYPSYLSYSTDYAKGYKDGVYVVHDNILELIKEMRNETKN